MSSSRSVVPNVLCSICTQLLNNVQKLRIENDVDWEGPEDDYLFDKPRLWRPLLLQQFGTIGQLSFRADEGCHLCTVFRHSLCRREPDLLHWEDYFEVEILPRDHVEVSLEVVRDLEPSVRLLMHTDLRGHFWIYVRAEHESEDAFFAFETRLMPRDKNETRGSPPPPPGFANKTEKLNPMRGPPAPHALPHKYTGSEPSFRWIVQQLEHCRKHHPSCDTRKIFFDEHRSFRPRRLLDITKLDSVGTVNLVDGVELPAQSKYLTVSHRCSESIGRHPIFHASTLISA